MLTLLAGCGGRSARSDAGPYGSGGNEPTSGGASSAGTTAVGGASAAGGVDDYAGADGETCAPGAAPLRRLTRAEYVSSVNALFGDVSAGLAKLPPEQRGFPTGNQAVLQAVDADLVTAYFQLGKELANQATSDPKRLAELAPCAAAAKPDTIQACARSTVEAFASKAFRRAPTPAEVDELLALHDSIRASGGTFAQATAGAISAVLQAPDFLYRIEWGTDEGSRAGARPLTGEELATRLSYLFWGAPPDEALRAAAKSGALSDPAEVQTQAARLLADPRARAGLAVFFDDFLELYRLPELQRSDPEYNSDLGASLQQATQRFLEARIFDQDGSWQSVLTAPTAFVNGPVSRLYGIAGISGDALREVSLDGAQRLGLLTQPSLLMLTLNTDSTNPTARGYRIMETMLCRDVPPEPPDVPAPIAPDPVGSTRQRWTQLTSGPSCVPCHHDMDQLGFAFENFDALGRYRTSDNGFDIDTKVDVTGLGPTNGPVELVRKLAVLPEAQTCFARRLTEFSLGKALAGDAADACLVKDLGRRFEASGYNVRQLLLDLTQTNAFLYLPKDR